MHTKITKCESKYSSCIVIQIDEYEKNNLERPLHGYQKYYMET